MLRDSQRSCARCGLSKQWLDASPGERLMLGPTIPQMSVLNTTEPLWFEQTQDMSGYVMTDTISPQLDEQLDFTFSTAQIENDFNVQNLENPSPEEFNWGDQTEAILGDDSNMFDNSSYNELHTKINAWLPKISNMEIDEFAKTSMIEENVDFLPRIDPENSLIFSETSKADKTPSASIVKRPRYLSIFDSEVPYIKEEPDMIPSSCTGGKSMFHLKDDMEVAEEVVVTTEQSGPKSILQMNSFLFDSGPLEYSVDPKEEVVITSDTVEDISSPLSKSSAMENPFDLNLHLSSDEDFLYNLVPPTPEPLPRVAPQLRLDIEAAMAASSQLLSGSLQDTPEVLRPVLKPGAGFDLVDFLLANGDSNNNTVTPTTPAPSTNPSLKRVQERRQGKSHLSLSDLRECQKYGRGKSSPRNLELEPKPAPEPSATVTSSGRPPRKSATKFKKLLQEGLLDSSTFDSNSVSSEEEEDSIPKRKRRRSSSSLSSRQRLNSDSDLSSVCDIHLKYRERRDRNNVSSKRSRQKRKVQQELKKVELKDLEQKNRRLKKKAEELEAVLAKVHMAWKEYLATIKKEN